MLHCLWAAFEGGVTCAGAGGDVVVHNEAAYWDECCDYRNPHMSDCRF